MPAAYRLARANDHEGISFHVGKTSDTLLFLRDHCPELPGRATSQAKGTTVAPAGLR
jgi:hypothetical protein